MSIQLMISAGFLLSAIGLIFGTGGFYFLTRYQLRELEKDIADIKNNHLHTIQADMRTMKLEQEAQGKDIASLKAKADL